MLDLGSPNGNAASAQPPPSLHKANLALELHHDEGQIAENIATVHKRYQEEFAEADTNHDRAVTEDETGAPRVDRVRHLRTAADRNRDGRLTEQELEAWLSFHEQVARGHVLVTMLDYGPGLFEFLDANHDGALSRRELRGAWDRMQAENCVVDGHLDLTRIPHQLRAIASRGRPQSVLTVAAPLSSGPEWFLAMDRNGDGDVSNREFLGPADDFRRLDGDGDGLLSASEAAPRPDKAP